jgi:hypothetical protein
MPYKVKFDQPPAGYSLVAARKDEEALIQTFEFTSMAEGQYFVQRLEGFPNEILNIVSKATRREFHPSQIDHMLAIIDADGTTTVYINELVQKDRVRAGRAVKGGETVFRDDIIEIVSVDLGVTIPPDAGFRYLFSRGWRKGLIYDFGPIAPDREARTFDCSSMFAQAHTYVEFQEKFSLSDSDWEALFNAKWFPFAGLRHSTVQKSFDHIRAGWGLSELIAEVTGELRNRAPDMLDAWRSHPSFGPHLGILEHAVDRFVAEDYISATALIYPRIEGILRTHHKSTGAPKKPTQGNLVKSAIADRIEDKASLLLPDHFARYLSEVYFADFNPDDPKISVARHSVSHGVASVDDFNQISVAVGLLVVHQLFYSLVRPQMNATAPAEGPITGQAEGAAEGEGA